MIQEDNNSKYYENESTDKNCAFNPKPHESTNKSIIEDKTGKILHDQSIENVIATANINLNENEEKNITTVADSAAYPITWLPAMVVSSESQNAGQSFMIEASGEGRTGSNMMSSNSYLHLPVSYSNDGTKIIGIVIGPNSVMPIESINNLNVVNFPNNFSKINNDSSEWADSLQNVKLEGERNQENMGEINYSNIAGEHSSIKDPVYCVYCSKVYKSMAEMQTHIMIDHADNPHIASYIQDNNYIHPSLRICPGCGNQLSRVGSFENGYPSETNEDEQNMGMGQSSTTIHLICMHCCKEYNLDIYNDPQQPHGPNQNMGDINIPSGNEITKRHYCDHCAKSYKHSRDLKKHLRTHHGIETSTQSGNTHQGSSSFQTGANTTQASGFHQDAPPPSAKLPCDICNKMFRGPFELRRHIHTVHENKRPYKCKDCFKVFRDAYELKRHSASHQRLQYHSVASSNVPLDPNSSVEMIHLPNINDSQMDIGSKTQQNAQQLVTSSLLRDVYSGPHVPSYPGTSHNADYFCTTCDKYFRGANEFKRHYSVVHEKKYRYKCVHCGKLWRDQYDLKRHCRRSHFVNQEIDKAFIRQCLLDNNNENVSRQTSAATNFVDPNPIPSMNITLDHEAVAAIFGTTNQDCQQSELNIHQESIQDPSAIMFQGMNSGLPSASMLYHSDDNSHIGNSMIQPEDITIPDSNKDTIGWADFENDMKEK